MTEQEIIEGAKLIMNSPFASDQHKLWIEKLIKFEGKPDTAYENAKYHSSWDWIMPVYKKCLDNWKANYKSSQDCNSIFDFLWNELWECKIEGTWEQVIEYIQWYNQNNK